VDNLEGRVASFEDNQFSTTTKLFGQAIFGIQGRTEDNEFQLAGTQVDEDTNVTLIDNVQLSLFTQFGPRSLLLTSFQAGNGNLSSFPDTLGNYVR
ncbi:MAG TPA: porin, partial [Cyanobacteria bacterium UBA12227]|nr:porin [Cyanobacteria bacterium UBA12227]